MIKPEQAYILVSLSGTTATLYCEDIDYGFYSEPFQRIEYTHEKQRNALELTTGARPEYGYSVSGVPYQVIYTGGGITPATARNLLPDDNDVNNIYRRFDGIRYNFKGTTSINTDVVLAHQWASQHRILINQFKAHQLQAQGAVSIQFILNFQAETFSYLTTTGLTVVSGSLGTLNNLLIEDFKVIGDYEIPLAVGNQVLFAWTMTAKSTQIVTDSP